MFSSIGGSPVAGADWKQLTFGFYPSRRNDHLDREELEKCSETGQYKRLRLVW